MYSIYSSKLLPLMPFVQSHFCSKVEIISNSAAADESSNDPKYRRKWEAHNRVMSYLLVKGISYLYFVLQQHIPLHYCHVHEAKHELPYRSAAFVSRLQRDEIQ
jgi:hypothetical protein